MPATAKRPPKRTKLTPMQRSIQAALRKAGERGMRRAELAEAVGCSDSYLNRCVALSRLAIVSPARYTQDRRMYHPSFEAAAQAQAERSAAYHVERQGHPNLSRGAAQAVLDAVRSSGTRGSTLEAMAEAAEASVKAIMTAAPWLRAQGVVLVRCSDGQRARYYAKGNEPAAQPKAAAVLAAPAVRSKPVKPPPPQVVITGRTKITIAPPFVDRRFVADPDNVPALFVSHGIGHYLPHDSAISRAYGGAA